MCVSHRLFYLPLIYRVLVLNYILGAQPFWKGMKFITVIILELVTVQKAP